MNPQQFHRLTALFDAASELPEEQRSAFLDGACSDDAELRREVEELLRHDDEPPHPVGPELSVHKAGCDPDASRALAVAPVDERTLRRVIREELRTTK